jgi:hypothetical protein
MTRARPIVPSAFVVPQEQVPDPTRLHCIKGPYGQLFRMSEWENFYRRLAREARERAAQATNPSTRAALEKVASEWSELADWVERQHKRAAA